MGRQDPCGIDCSGLVQLALATAGISRPRATPTCRKRRSARTGSRPCKRKRGDLVFWNSHVAIMLDADRLIHANAFHMQVESEPLGGAIVRIAPVAGPVTAIKRL